jgi:hypothetical protein
LLAYAENKAEILIRENLYVVGAGRHTGCGRQINLVVSAMKATKALAASSFKPAKQRFFRLPSFGIGLAW